MELGKCIQPWYEFQFDYHDELRPCCYYSGDLESINFNISNSWNSNYFKKVRNIIKTKDNTVDNGCSNCDYLKITGKNWKQSFDNEIPRNIKLNDKISKKRFENYILAKKEFEEKKNHLQSLPVKIYINFGVKCNFKCTFCFQNIERENNDTRTISAESIFKEKEILKIAQEIHIIGGEPLLIKESIKFIELLKTDEDFKNINLRITTNGSLLHRYINKLDFFNFINVELSLEAYGDDLEKLRIGAKWEKINNNIKLFREYSISNKKNWILHIPCNIMATTLKNNNLFKLTNWCLENNIEIKFYKVNGITKYDFENEDYFQNPKLLNQIGKNKFNTQFEKTLDLLEQYQKHSTSDNLKEIYKLSKISEKKLSFSYKVDENKTKLKKNIANLKSIIYLSLREFYSKIIPKEIRYKIGKLRRKN